MSHRLEFCIVCVIWGATWIAIKTGVEHVPPLFFGATRLITAGLLILLWRRLRGESISVAGPDRPRLVVVGVLIAGLTYAFLFWGMQFVDSGLAAVVNMSLMPIALYAFGILQGSERLNALHCGALIIGLLGLVALFRPALPGSGGEMEIIGLAAVVLGSLAYCWGSVLNRGLLRRYDPFLLSGYATLIGGVFLLPLSMLLEPVTFETFMAYTRADVLAGWLFLIFGGSLIALTLFFRLLHAWGPARAGLYGFLSPVIAVLIGILLFGEEFDLVDAIGSALLLGSALAILRRPLHS